MEEQWKPVPGWEDAYEISCLGNLRTIARVQCFGSYKKFKESIPCKTRLTTAGYPIYSLSYNGKKKAMLIHRLVAEAFIVNPDNKPFVNHIDGRPTNNRVDNLEWCTPRENVIHAYRIGLQVMGKGEKHHRAIMSDGDAIEIHRLCSECILTRREIAEIYGISISNIGSILSTKSWTHLGLSKSKSNRRSLMGNQTKETVDKIWELHQGGNNFVQIGKVVGLHHNTIRERLKKLKSQNN